MAQTFVRDVAEGRDAKPYVQRVLLWQTIVTASGRSARYHWLNNSLGRRSLIHRWCNPLKCKLFQVVVRSSLSNQDEHKLKSTGTHRPTTTSTTLRAYRSRILVVHCPAPGPLSFSRSPLHPHLPLSVLPIWTSALSNRSEQWRTLLWGVRLFGKNNGDIRTIGLFYCPIKFSCAWGELNSRPDYFNFDFGCTGRTALLLTPYSYYSRRQHVYRIKINFTPAHCLLVHVFIAAYYYVYAQFQIKVFHDFVWKP